MAEKLPKSKQKAFDEYRKKNKKFHPADPRHPMNSELTGPSVTIQIMSLPKSKPKKAKGGVAHKAEMSKGGMANGKLHMYTGGGAVKDKLGPGLTALNKVRPDVVKKMLKK